MKKIIQWFSSRGPVVAFLVLYLIATIAFREQNMLSISSISKLFGKATTDASFVAIGMTFVILIGQIDLSVGSVMALSGVLMAMFSKTSPVLGILVALSAGMFCGLINGLIVTRMRISSWITTLSMMLGLRGIVLFISGQKPIKVTDPFLKVLGNTKIPLGGKTTLPILVLFFLGLIFLCMHIARNTKFGTSLYAVGGNEDAARMMGLPVDKIKVKAFVACSFFAALSGVFMASRLGTAQPNIASGWETTAIAMCALGGVKLSGGQGKFSGTFFGVMIITIINIIFNYAKNFEVSWQQVVMGGVILLSIGLQSDALPKMINSLVAYMCSPRRRWRY